jgi:hypothetical protein
MNSGLNTNKRHKNVSAKDFAHPCALPSVEESVQHHLSVIQAGKTCRSFLSKDPETQKIATQFLKQHPWLEKLNIAAPPNQKNAKGSLVVTIDNISNAPTHDQHRYAQYRKSNKRNHLCIGGPAAESYAVMKTLLGKHPEELYYYTRIFGESNAAWSASQLHNRHGTALNANSALTGNALLPTFIKRNTYSLLHRLGAPISHRIVQNAMRSNYIKIDMNFAKIKYNGLLIYLRNELHWLKNKLKKIGRFQRTSYEKDRCLSIASQKIYTYCEALSGRTLTSLGSTKKQTSIHIATTTKERATTLHENHALKTENGILSQELSFNEKKMLFGDLQKHIAGAWVYQGDGHSLFNSHDENKKIVTSQGGNWQESREIKTLYIDTSGDRPILAGVKYKNLKTQQCLFQPTSSAFLTLGYKARFQYKKHPDKTNNKIKAAIKKIKQTFRQPIPPIGIATGCSVVAFFKKTSRLNAIIKKYTIFPEFAVTNSHWTLMAENEDHLMIRITGGGRVGEETYSPTYFINLIANTNRLFLNTLVGILSVNGCSRTLNPENSGRFVKICDGLLVSYGKGGTGITKRYIEALIALRELGHNDVLSHMLNEQPELLTLLTQCDADRLIRDKSHLTNRLLGSAS